MKPISEPPFHRPNAQIVGHLSLSPTIHTHLSSSHITIEEFHQKKLHITEISSSPLNHPRGWHTTPSGSALCRRNVTEKNKNKHLRWMFIQSASVPLDGVKQSHHWPAPAPISATWGADRDLPRPWPPLIGSPAQLTDNQGAQQGICIRVVYRCGLRSLLESFVSATKGKWGRRIVLFFFWKVFI